MKRFQKFTALIAAVTVLSGGITPSFLMAQDSSGYGQALGQRKSQTRPLNPTLQQGESTQTHPMSAPEAGLGYSRSAAVLDSSAYQIHIVGMVRHPGTYRLPPSTRMAEAIDMAGGLEPKGSMRRIELRRHNRTIHVYDLSAFLSAGRLDQNPFLQDNDEIYVPISERVVSIRGPVNRSGVMELLKEQSLTDVVTLAGGYTVGIIKTEPVTVIRHSSGKKVTYHVSMSDADMANFIVEDGDYIVFPHVLTKGRKFDYNIAELPNDTLFYPSFNDNVFIMGAVAQPGAYPYNPFYDVRHYMNMAGLVRYANVKRVKIIDVSGKPVKYTDEYRLNPGDTIVVPYRAWTTDNVLKWYNTISNTIFTSFALQQLIKNQ